jgi:ATP-dependent helicase/nuclease subunit B
VLTYAGGDLSGAVQSPSELIDSLRAVFPELPIVRQKELSPYFFSQSRSTAFLQAARLPDGAERQTLEQVLDESSEWQRRLRRLTRLSEGEQRQIQSGELAQALFAPLGQRGERTVLDVSPSQVEQYYSCPFAYFCRYGLGVRSLQKAELSPLARGSIIHFLLEKILQQPDFVTLDEAALQKLTLQLLAEYLDQVLGGKEEKSAKFLYYFYRLTESVQGILSALQREFQSTSFTVCRLEEVIREGARIEPFTVDDRELVVRVAGKIDRVDLAETDGESMVRVIDYKTGGKQFKLEEAERGLNLQMLLYLFAIWQGSESGHAFAGAVPAGILYMPAKAFSPGFDRHEGGEEARELLYRMNGLVLDEDRVLKAMEGDRPGAFIETPSPRSRQDSRISREGLSELREKVSDLLIEMGHQLLSGQIAPAPQGRGNTLPCSWCDYKTLCGRG